MKSAMLCFKHDACNSRRVIRVLCFFFRGPVFFWKENLVPVSRASPSKDGNGIRKMDSLRVRVKFFSKSL
jgi:hypothetical protein